MVVDKRHPTWNFEREVTLAVRVASIIIGENNEIGKYSMPYWLHLLSQWIKNVPITLCPNHDSTFHEIGKRSSTNKFWNARNTPPSFCATESTTRFSWHLLLVWILRTLTIFHHFGGIVWIYVSFFDSLFTEWYNYVQGEMKLYC